MLHFVYILAFFWGVFYALFLHFTPWGTTLRIHITWMATTIGIGVDLLLLLVFMNDQGLVAWLDVFAVIALSAVGIVAAGLWEIHSMLRRTIKGARNGQQ